MTWSAPTPDCVSCNGTVAPDGHCWDCGAAQPVFRAHIEHTLETGAAAVTDRGLRRGVNADAMALTSANPWTIGVVTDGVSMSPRPERAAQVAAETAAKALTTHLTAGAIPENALTSAAAKAAEAVAALGPRQSAPACTYVAAIASTEGIWTSWIGDSRAYWLPTTGPAILMTEDDTGELETLANWLGADAPDPTPGTRSLRPTTQGSLLLCADGLWRYLPTAESIRAKLTGNPAADTRSLTQHALNSGGHDNTTVLIIPWPNQPRTARV